ncbi:MAG: NUDIX domain-containing protein [Ignavibacteria bacterium]|nr:NUDIX domain-containing protein [Ignavibacteria bacterium]MBK7444916.1 NUDIX domain-containing protein [Ignavibacteria bacterium]MBK8383547.1 NUDIX domain-containing protein [Ignavibacteria bacterium]MBL0107524.1 NUDIX domain-containing protein [Ignavibacteria bacterium]
MPAQPTKDKAIGVIVYFEFPRSTKYLIVKHKKGHWSFAKGHKEKDESSIQTARRELFEEAGIKEVEFLAKKILAREKYFFNDRNKSKVRKVVSYFIAKSGTSKIRIDNKEIINYKWCTLNAADRILTYKQSRKIIKKVDVLIRNKKSKNLKKVIK